MSPHDPGLVLKLSQGGTYSWGVAGRIRRRAGQGRETATIDNLSLSEGAAPRGAKLPQVSSDATPERTLALILDGLSDAKAEDVVAIDVRGKTPMADHVVVASGRSHRHVNAIAERLLQDLKDAGVRDVKAEGQTTCDWVLIDGGDVIVHIFRPEVRAFYNLEKMWSVDVAGDVQLVS